MQSPKKKPFISTQTILICVSAVLLLALIVVSAFAYTWNQDLKAQKRKVQTLQAEASSVSSLLEEVSNLQMENGNLKAQLEAYQNTDSAKTGN